MKDLELFWEEVKCHIREAVPDYSYRMWIDPVELLDHDDQRLTLSSPNAYSVQRLKDNYLPMFREAFSKLGRTDIQIDFKVQSCRKDPSARSSRKTGSFPAIALKARQPKQMDLPGMILKFNNGRLLKKGFTFDDFVVGTNSDFAYSASLSLANGKRKGSNMIYLLAKTGLGKSHLSQAVGHHILTRSRSKSVYYITAEDFTNEMIHSIRANTIDQFKERYRKQCDVLILEDIHFLAGKEATQKELAMTLDYLLEAEKKIIFSGCERPDEIPRLNDHLKSRLTLGLVTEITPPDFETRVRILNKKSRELGYGFSREVTEYIAQELSDNVRQLESGLNSVAAKGQLLGYNIDIDLARSVLANIINARKRATVESIKRLVCHEFSISDAEIVSSSRQKRISKARQIAIFLSRKYTDQSIKQIGSNFNRYHATAIYAIHTVEKELAQKGMVFEQVSYLSRKIETGNF